MNTEQPNVKGILDNLVTTCHNRVVNGDSFDVSVLWPIEEAMQAIESLIAERERLAKVWHAADVARAVGLLDGLGHPDEYLAKRLAELQSTKEEND